MRTAFQALQANGSNHSAFASHPLSSPHAQQGTANGWSGGEPGRAQKQPAHVICGQEVESFVAYASAGSVPSAARHQLMQAGVRLEEHISNKQPVTCDVFILTRMLAVTLASATASHSEGSQQIQPSLLLLSNDRDLMPALSLLRRSGQFDRVMLVHSSGHMVDDATPAVLLSQLLEYYPLSASSAARVGVSQQMPWLDEAAEDVYSVSRSTSSSSSSSSGSIPGGLTPSSSSAPSAASTPQSLASYRFLSPSPSNPTSNPPASHPSHSSSECLHAFAAIIHCCEREKIIPRESVLRKKILDGRHAIGVEFEEFLTVVMDSGSGVVEGCSPQRVVWPREGQMARRFACADFFQPTQRLSAEQTQELIAFLHRARPEIERGRFGFAQWLSRHGPRFIQALPHGVLVELVQLLLNKKILQFRKGRVSVTPNSAVASSLTSLTAGVSSAPSNYTSHSSSSAYMPNHLSNGGENGGRSHCGVKQTLMAVPFVSTPSDRAFIPSFILPFTSPFNAVDLILQLCSLRRSVSPSSCNQYPSHLPLYHYEQTISLTSSTVVWVSVCTVVFRVETSSAHGVARQFKSTQHESKESAKQESARRALQEALWHLCFDRCMSELRQLENRQREGESRQQRQAIQSEEQQRSECEERHQQQTADSVTQLDRHLVFLSQSAIVYTLQSHVMQNSAGARTLWQARGQVMLQGALLPKDTVRVRAWNGCELTLSSTPVVSYAAEARKTQAKVIVSQQLITKMIAAAAAIASQPTHHAPRAMRTPLPPSAASASCWPAPRSATDADTLFTSTRASTYAEQHDSVRSWRASSTPVTCARSSVSLTSNTLFAFPAYSDQQRLGANGEGDDECGYEDELSGQMQSGGRALLSACGERNGGHAERELNSKRWDEEVRAEGQEMF